ncbi:MAG: OadG family protein [Treponema sp.]|nr:OadG family protein [Treponema sp.]
MTIVEMLGQSVILTLLGMGIVFSFLFILVLSITAMGKVVGSFGADSSVQQFNAAAGVTGTEVNETAAAISAAVTEYRKNN